MVSSEAVILRRELGAVIATSNEQENEIARLHGVIAQLRAKVAGGDVELAAAKAVIAQLCSQLGEKDGLIALLERHLADAGIKISDLERREAYHDSAHVPPSNRSITLRQMRRDDIEAQRRASTGRGPGREYDHEGTTLKLDVGDNLEHRRAVAPEECPKCGHAHFRQKRGIPRDQVDIEIKKNEKRYVLHDLECAGCGHVVKAHRGGIVPGTILGPKAVAFVGSLKHHCHATAGQVRGVLSDAFGIGIGRTSAAAGLNAAADGLAGRADAIRELEEAMALPAEADESRDRTAVMKEPEDDGTSPPGTGKNRWRLEYQDGWAWIVASDRSVRVWVSTSRGKAAFEGNFPDRTGAGTAHDSYGVYGACRVSQDDWVHKIRNARHLAKRERSSELRAALEALADGMAGDYKRARNLVAPGGAFPDAGARENAASIKAAMGARADEYDRLGKRKMATYVRNGCGKYATFIRYPGVSPNTARAEHTAKWLKKWLNSSEKTVTAEGRRRKSDMCTVGLTAILRGLSLHDLLCEDLGMPPPDEYAHVRAEGQREPRSTTRTASGAIVRPGRDRAAQDPGRNAAAGSPLLSLKCGGEGGTSSPAPAPAPAPAVPAAVVAAAAAAAKPAAAKTTSVTTLAGPAEAKPATGKAKEVKPTGTARTKRTPKERQRRPAITPSPKVAAIGRPRRGRPDEGARPPSTTARTAPVAAPSGPGPPSAGGGAVADPDSRSPIPSPTGPIGR